MEAQAWVGKCEGCGLYCVLYEQVEFVCGKCHGSINPGNAISEPIVEALDTLFDAGLPTTEVLRVIWLQATPEEPPTVTDGKMRLVDAPLQYPDPLVW
jgi:hypothetical protein